MLMDSTTKSGGDVATIRFMALGKQIFLFIDMPGHISIFVHWLSSCVLLHVAGRGFQIPFIHTNRTNQFQLHVGRFLNT